ncbi:divalent cation tolerance protein CutA [uncultured Helicobacter sp.]|uniref:divalent cation tolerance protein CutA n=1 Tax=uncultured Helicobacter sp. TaxID=175537 RepID=UPI00261A3A15|nr:divalent cation tolerance protein CutA [uncultured Helicobacter sp.]
MRLMLLQTTTTESNAKLLIKTALELRLCSCIQQTQIQSSYVWKKDSNFSQIVSEEEVLLNFKVFKKDFKTLKKTLLKNHAYELPEIVGIKLHKVSAEYKKWCKNAFLDNLE